MSATYEEPTPDIYTIYCAADAAAGVSEEHHARLEVVNDGREIALKFADGFDDMGRTVYLSDDSAASLGKLLGMLTGTSPEFTADECAEQDAAVWRRQRAELVAGTVIVAVLAALVFGLIVLAVRAGW